MMLSSIHLCFLIFLFEGCYSSGYTYQPIVERPVGLATYTPSTSNFSGVDFLKWINQQPYSSDGYRQLAVAHGQYDVYSTGTMLGLSNMNNTILWFDGVTLTFRVFQTTSSITAWNTNNCAIRGLTIHQNPPGTSQAVIYNITKIANGKNWVDLRVCDGYSSDFFYKTTNTLLPKEPFQPIIDLSLGNFATNLSSDGRSFRIITYDGQMANGNMIIGSMLAVRGLGHVFHYIRAGSNFSFVDYTMTSSAGMGWWIDWGYGGHRFERVKIMRNPSPPVPGGVPPLMSLSSDGIHIVGMHRGPTIIDSYFDGMGDDCINMLQFFSKIWSAQSDSSVFMQTYGHWQTGDRLRLYDSDLHPMGYATITSMRNVTNGNATVVLSVLYNSSAYASNLDRTNSDFVISRNTFYNSRGRGILCKAHRGEISHNNFSVLALGGIDVQPETGSWMEGDYAADVAIKYNVLEDIGFYGWTGYGSSISVRLNRNYQYGGDIPPAGAFSNISITDNIITGSWGHPIEIYSTSASQFSRNQIYGPFRSSFPVVNLYNNEGLVMSDNCAWGNTTGVQLSNVNATSGLQADCANHSSTESSSAGIDKDSSTTISSQMVTIVSSVNCAASLSIYPLVFVVTLHLL
ncbi:hypothetical protein PROFUN_05359 [Planoprotostelium fungivorum]|uniref:Right handed beta helix domain-containing protein n=1 Tax=Planoprotostelium fungivorum TaxID=1890364 RepID=A0A2P6NR79_9EUKA|nr:hypothetical protein PROFUN_05359 [Planoprotostelium fungivorum]